MAKVIVVAGVTGTGKSSLAQRLAHKLNGQVICADSTQLNRGLDVLTNKSKNVLMTARYDIQDCVDANRYTVDCRKLMLNLIDEGKVPIIEGGSWFYIRHLFTGAAD